MKKYVECKLHGLTEWMDLRVLFHSLHSQLIKESIVQIVIELWILRASALGPSFDQ